MNKVKVLAHSANLFVATTPEIVTFLAVYPRIIHSELMTHRVFSRNASSSRAIPVKKQIADVLENPYIPAEFGTNKAGMQPGSSVSKLANTTGRFIWKTAMYAAVGCAKALNVVGIHKQWVNRLLEPFSHITVVITTTELDNFFNLRISEFAQGEIRDLAENIKEKLSWSRPEYLERGDWHSPFDYDPMRSAACCARTSYRNHNGTKRYERKDLDLAEELLRKGHMSPFEHQAQCATYPKSGDFNDLREWDMVGFTHVDRHGNFWSGNLRGWIQHRQLLSRGRDEP